MQAAYDIFTWLFSTTYGVISLIVGGMIFFFIVAALLEKKTHSLYFNHPQEMDEESYFDAIFSDKDEE